MSRVATKQPSSLKANRDLWILSALVVLSIVAFAVYYYYDRYVHENENLLDQQAQRVEEMVRQNPQNPNVRVAVAAFYSDKGLTNLAIEQAQEALKLEPNHQGALVVLGTAYAKSGDVDQAVASLERVAEMNKDNRFAKLDTNLQGVYYQLGSLYDRQGQSDLAVAVFKKMIDADETDADAHTALALLYQKQSNHAEAVREIQAGLRYDPFSTESYRALAVSYTALGSAPEAAYAKGMAAFTQDKFADAATQLGAVVAQSPDLTPAYLGLGLAYEQLGKRDQAIDALKRYVAANPKDIVANSALARLSEEVKP